MKRSHAWILAALVILCALGVRWRASEARVAPSTRVAAAPVATPPAPAPPQPAAPSVQPAPDAEPPVARLDPRSDPMLADRARQHELAPEADARWEQAVAGGGYTANDLDASVRDLFRLVNLEPRYAEGGRIDGLVITSMPPDHPFAQLGFRSGDRIDRIQGVALRDPAEIPSLLARLGPNFSLCVDRAGQALCGDIQLE